MVPSNQEQFFKHDCHSPPCGNTITLQYGQVATIKFDGTLLQPYKTRISWKVFVALNLIPESCYYKFAV